MSMTENVCRKFRILVVDGSNEQQALRIFDEVVCSLVSKGAMDQQQFEVELVREAAPSDIRPDRWRHRLRAADAILFIQRGHWNGYVPERFFELLALGRPLLAMVSHPDSYRDYCNSKNNVYVVGKRGRRQIRDGLSALYMGWKRGAGAEPGRLQSGCTRHNVV